MTAAVFQSTVNVNLGFGVLGQLLIDGPLRAQSLITDANGGTVGNFFVQNAATGAATQGGVISSGAASVTGAISGTTLTVSAVASGAITVGMTLTGSGLTTCTVTAYGTGVGGTGTYTVSVSQTFASGAIAGAGTAYTLGGFLVNPVGLPGFSPVNGFPIDPTLVVPAYNQADFLTMGTIVVYNNSTSCNIGDLVAYNVSTGAVSTYSPYGSVPAGCVQVPNAVVYRYNSSVAGLIAVRLTN
jgi:hypothetical protein